MAERVALQANNGRFRPGQKRPPNAGRKPGVQNRTTRLLREAVLLAAEAQGADGRGRDKLVGFLQTFARKFPVEFVQHLLAKLIPMQAVIEASMKPQETMTLPELEAKLRARGLPLAFVAPLPADQLPPTPPPGARLN